MRILLLALTLAQMMFIFRMSAAPAVESAELSGSITRRVADVMMGLFGGLDEAARLLWTDRLEFVIRKAAHATEYAILGLLLAADVRVWFGGRHGTSAHIGQKPRGIRQGTLPLFSWLCGTLYAMSDEWHQTFVEGRSGEWRDVAIDAAGVLVGVLLLSWVERLADHRRERRG